ncbi:MAG TPA: hypothetical protein VGB37_09895 [Candidatus Lokiarchaeia archaeon]
MTIETKKSKEKKLRAKATKINVNKKSIKFPRKVIHTSLDNIDELTFFKKEFDTNPITELVIKITPKRLREIVSNSSEHPKTKDNIRAVFSQSGTKGFNVGYPLLINERSPGEKESEFISFGKPTEKIIEKIYDLFDVEQVDAIIFPAPSPNGDSSDWCKMSTDVFTNRKPDYMSEETMFSGIIPIGIPESKAIKIANYYITNGLESLTFDFCSRKVPESRMRAIIDEIGDKWNNLYVHGTNVPSYNFHGTFKTPSLASYDLLISVYGFDSFGNIRIGRAGELPEKNKIKTKMQSKRFRLTETYGDYNYEGLKAILSSEKITCNSPIFKTRNPLDIYDNKEITEKSFIQLTSELKQHRNYISHKEMIDLYDLISKEKYDDYLQTKKAATKELNSIYAEMGVKKLKDY